MPGVIGYGHHLRRDGFEHDPHPIAAHAGPEWTVAWTLEVELEAEAVTVIIDRGLQVSDDEGRSDRREIATRLVGCRRLVGKIGRVCAHACVPLNFRRVPTPASHSTPLRMFDPSARLRMVGTTMRASSRAAVGVLFVALASGAELAAQESTPRRLLIVADASSLQFRSTPRTRDLMWRTLRLLRPMATSSAWW